jgi:hypothetical protein
VSPRGRKARNSAIALIATIDATSFILQALLGSARLHVQVDVGIGDAVVPEPEWLEYPSLLDFPMPRLKVYRPETAIAEKLHAMGHAG